MAEHEDVSELSWRKYLMDTMQIYDTIYLLLRHLFTQILQMKQERKLVGI